MENKTILNLISEYDSGETIELVNMSGMGEGYEKAIQEFSIDIMRELAHIECPNGEDAESKNRFRAAIELAESIALPKSDHGLSGAQVGAAKNQAAVFWRNGWTNGLEMMRQKDPERVIKARLLNSRLHFESKI